MSVPFLNAETVADLVANSADAQRVAWLMKAMRPLIDYCPFYDGFIGGPGSGKAICALDDMNVTGGNSLVVTTYAKLAGRGVQGNATLMGNGEKLRNGAYRTKTGRFRHSVELDDVAKEETLIGSQSDQIISELLAVWLNEKKSYDLQVEAKRNAIGRNTIFVNNVGAIDGLGSADYILTDTVDDGAEMLRTNGAKPMNTATDPTGARRSNFMLYASHFALAPIKKTDKYLEAIRLAAERGEKNPTFTGEAVAWGGQGIYTYETKDHDAFGPVGSPLVPRLLLGNAGGILSGTAPLFIQGGGSALGAAAGPATNPPPYTEFWSGAQYVGCEGEKVPAVNNVTRYGLIQAVSGPTAGLFGMFSYQVNDGNKITVLQWLGSAGIAAVPGVSAQQVTTLGGVTFNTGIWANKHANAAGAAVNFPEGSVVMQCTYYGQPFVFGLYLGESAEVCGHANIDGKLGKGNRITQDVDYGMQQGIGLQTAWGCAVARRTDGFANNYLLVVGAFNPPGLPVIASDQVPGSPQPFP